MLASIYRREEANDYCELYGGYLAQVQKFNMHQDWQTDWNS